MNKAELIQSISEAADLKNKESEALLDARPVPGDDHLVVATLTRHNAPPRGSIAFVDALRAKNGTLAIANIEHPDEPSTDVGDSCDPSPPPFRREASYSIWRTNS